ncbi:hypothetical protein [Arvimicrobium flavum]|uniref:hypothetical protein n=1 Tax=Arvimicrobium flavum TaxID=3393320 RepID=UPI00237ABCB7|nr:hypothetical protein [Mesorhizobium shangrilense]
MDTPAEVIDTGDRDELDTLGLELALRDRQALDGDFAGCIVTALETVKGTLLFQMQIDAEPAKRKVAAVSVGHGETREYALIILPQGADGVRVERAADSDDPLAAIAPSFAGLIDVLDVAA